MAILPIVEVPDPRLRQISKPVDQVDDGVANPADLDALALPDEEAWLEARRPFLLYPAR